METESIAVGAFAVVIRRPNPDENDSVKTLVQTVVDETYGGAWAPRPLPIDNEDWSLAWIAISETQILGMVLTRNEWISDLWVLTQHRGRRVGRKLLLQGESEIAARGHRNPKFL